MREFLVLFGLIFGLFLPNEAVAREDRLSAGVRAYAHQQYALAAQLLQPFAQRGNPLAQTYLGFMYQDGRGLPLDYVEAARWFQAAAEQGEPTAQFFLATLYDRGLGVKRDFVEAEVWLNLAAAHGAGNEADYWGRMRDAVASKLTLDELAQARARALAFAPMRVP